MKKIGLISDTHGWIDDKTLSYLGDCDEVWHAGDFGSMDIANKIVDMGFVIDNKSDSKPDVKILKGVWGNIDGKDVRLEFPEEQRWKTENLEVFMIHIGGYPDRYSKGIKEKLIQNKTQLFICGHSHILKVIYDQKINCLHMNPGAAGKQGWHKVRTLIRFVIDGNEIKDCEVIELKP
ncbi:MAG: YfcE family phosphodiesterase [Bacteroidetes bacterium]|nr:MAG: YfcE family phosphodiesterase [Bacteroidota bacterium]